MGAAPVGTDEALGELVKRAVGGAGDSFKRRLAVLGSTGSIGTQTLDIVREAPHVFSVSALSAGSNVDLLVEQAREFEPELVSVGNVERVGELRAKLDDAGVTCRVVGGVEGGVECAAGTDADVVVTGIVGCAGLLPTVAAIRAGKDVALANKETLIAGGPVVVPLVKEHGVQMTAADSEHSAIFQCLQGAPAGALRKIILTASGGAFRDWKASDLQKVTLADALKHPNWSMGAKSAFPVRLLCFSKGTQLTRSLEASVALLLLTSYFPFYCSLLRTFVISLLQLPLIPQVCTTKVRTTSLSPDVACVRLRNNLFEFLTRTICGVPFTLDIICSRGGDRGPLSLWSRL